MNRIEELYYYPLCRYPDRYDNGIGKLVFINLGL
jgi:hypothetical protein